MSEWLQKFERAGFLGRVGLVGGGAVRLAASVIDKGIDRAATIAVDAKREFDREIDPNMSDAQIVEESPEPYRPE